MNLLNRIYITEADLAGSAGGCAPSFFCNHLFFCNHFEELQTVLTEVKLIINNAPLTYVYPDTVKRFLIPNHLLFDSQLLHLKHCSTAVRNLTIP